MSSVLLIWALSMVSGAAPATEASASFQSAQPVWLAGRAEEMNVFAGFRAVITPQEKAPAMLRVTAATMYRCFVNGEFVGHGPARGPHGWFRIDEWDLTPWLRPGKNVVSIEAAGYNANAYYVLDQPSFVQAEVVSKGAVLAATGASEKPFEAFALTERVEKVQRYSFQRPFIEVFRLNASSFDWRTNPDTSRERAACETVAAKEYLPRRVPYAARTIRPAARRLFSGSVDPQSKVERPWRDRSMREIGPKLKGYPMEQLETIVSDTLQSAATKDKQPVPANEAKATQLNLGENRFEILDLGQNLTGFVTLNVQCAKKTRLYVLFDEMLSKDDVDFLRLGCVNALSFELEPGTYHLQGFEPNTMRYLKLVCLQGECQVSDPGLLLYENPDTERAQFACSNPRINALFEAGRSTFAQNAVDIFMDCPHRERAGWLCDSFFTARSAVALSGNTAVEKNFLENFLLPKSFAHLPEGMLPMCYPSDHNDGIFIPNWSLWFVMQLGEYADRGNDPALVDALRPKVLALFDYFKRFENSDGLLEKLESWVFVEWSKANSFVQDVNYPSNMLYAGALSTAARLYQLPELETKAQAIRQTVLKQSFDGAFFVDNALRKNGKLEVTQNHSEVCQYFAFYFGVATPETHKELWGKLRDEFGPKRKNTQAYPEVFPANSFIGNMLRVELLSRAGRCQQILDESIDYLYYMAERTGTLWENIDDKASLNHGFASHITHTLQRDVLGVYRIDTAKKTVELRFGDANLESCEGAIPVGDAVARMKWRLNGNRIEYTFAAPQGYTVTVKNLSGKELVAVPGS